MMSKVIVLAFALTASTNAALLPAAAPVAYTGLPAYSGLPTYSGLPAYSGVPAYSGLPAYPYTLPGPAAYSALPYRAVAPVPQAVYPAGPFRAALPVPAGAAVGPVVRTALPAAFPGTLPAAFPGTLPAAPLVKAAPFTVPVAAPAVAAPVAAPLAVAPVATAKIDYADAYPQYQYAYNVQDALTGDSKAQEESREGGVVKGRYSLIDADGSRRTVTYYADPLNGFNAVVQKDLPVVAAPVAPVVRAAPSIVSV